MSDTTEVLYRFKLDWGRDGQLESLFIATRAQVATLKGKTLNFGSAFGKYSEVSCIWNEGDTELNEVTEDPAFIKQFLELNCCIGPNPLTHIPEEEENRCPNDD